MQESTFSTLKSRKMKFTSATQRQFITNYYSIKVNQKKCMIYQYSYSVAPEIENDSSRKLQNIIRNIWKELINKIGLISIRGNNLYGNIDFKGQTTHLSKIKNDQGTQIIYEVLIKKVKDLPLSQMVYSSKPQESYIAMQVINIDTKERLRKMNMIQMDQGKYYAKKKIVNQNFQTGFFVLKGFSFTAQKLKIGLSLHVQIFSRLIRQRNVLQQMNQMKSKDDINAILPGSIVITRYGNFRTYKVLDVDFTKSPLSKFTPKNQNQEVTYVDYYKHNYDVNINLKNQPLLHIITKIQKVKRKGDKTEKVIHEGYLIPQLVSLVGLSDEHRRNGPLMRQIASRTQINVQKRIKQTQDQIQMLNNQQGLYSIDSVVKVDGYQLQQPMIETKRSFQAQNGQIKIEKQLVKQPAYFKNWYFIVHRNYITEARQLQKALKVSSKAFGIVIEESTVYQMDEIKAQEWRDEIEQQFKYIKEKNEPWPQIIMVLMGGALKDTVYHQIKNLFTTKLKICTQFTQVSKIVAMNKKNQLLSYASNIILQMNAKVGKPIWQVPVKNPHLAKKSLMIGAMAVSKNGNQYSLGFVGTINPKLSKVYNETKIQKKRNEFTTGALSPIFTNWLKTYFQANGRKGLADIIIFYREGLTPTQAQRNVKLEVEALEEAIKQAKNKTKLTNYNPEIVYMSVNKRSTSRFYDQLGTSTSQQKFAPKFMNPFSGSVIVDSLCGQNITNFNLASTCPNAGYTASPSEFIIHYHNPKRTPEQAFIELSFEQCFNYYNWRGAIKSPACLQNADRLAKLAGKSLKSDITPDNQLSKLHHFL